MSVPQDQLSILPHSRIITSVGTQTPADVEGVVEDNHHLLLGHEICVTRLIARLHGGKAKVMLTNFSQEFKYINKGMTIAYMEEIVETSNAFDLSDSVVVQELVFDRNPSFPRSKQQQLKSLP